MRSGLAPSRFHFAVMDFFLLPKPRAFSGLASELARTCRLWRSQWMRRRLRLASPEKGTSSARISLWLVEVVLVSHSGVRETAQTQCFSDCGRNWLRYRRLSLVR